MDVGQETPLSAPVPGSLSVEEICAFDLLRDSSVLAGRSGLQRRVQRLNVMTVPDIVQWTKPHVFLLATGFPLAHAQSNMATLLRELDERGVSALAVKLGNYGAELDDETLDFADRIGLPLIAVPQHVAFDDILSQVLSAIANKQAAALGRAQQLHQTLLRISLAGTLGDIVSELSKVLGGMGVICVNTAGEVLAECAEESHWKELRSTDLVDGHGALTRLNSRPETITNRWPQVAVAQIPASELIHGHLVAVSCSQPLDQEIAMMLEQAAMVAALSISKERAVVGVTRRFEANALHGLLTGNEDEIREVVERARTFEWDLDRPLVVIAARRTPPTHDGGPREHEVAAWIAAVRQVDRYGAAGMLGRDLVGLCGAEDSPEEIGYHVHHALTPAIRTQVTIGVSDVVRDAAALPEAYQQSRMALEFTQQSPTEEIVRSYHGLGLFRLLNAIPDQNELEFFVEETLGPVLALSSAERADMLNTLQALITNRMNVAETSRALHFHYNTLRYRIRKLEQLLGAFTEDSQLELRIAVALHILRIRRLTERSR